MSGYGVLLWPPLLAFALSLLILLALLKTGLAVRLALDEPNKRSLHAVAVPRVGGVAIVSAALVAWCLVPGAWAALGLLTALLALISVLDDRHGLPVTLRLAAHLGAAGVCAFALLPQQPWLALLLLLYLAGMANCYNFMDGADGLAGGMTVFGFGAYGVAAVLAQDHSIAAMSLALCAAAAAFLLFNFAPARVFMGDVGSIPLGFAAAALGALGVVKALWPLWFPLLVFSPFCVDAGITLMRRLGHGERFWQAHRQHYYQRLIRMGWSHARTALCAYVLMLGVAVSAVWALRLETAAQLGLLLAWGVIYALLLWRIDARWQTAPPSLSA